MLFDLLCRQAEYPSEDEDEEEEVEPQVTQLPLFGFGSMLSFIHSSYLQEGGSQFATLVQSLSSEDATDRMLAIEELNSILSLVEGGKSLNSFPWSAFLATLPVLFCEENLEITVKALSCLDYIFGAGRNELLQSTELLTFLLDLLRAQYDPDLLTIAVKVLNEIIKLRADYIPIILDGQPFAAIGEKVGFLLDHQVGKGL